MSVRSIPRTSRSSRSRPAADDVVHTKVKLLPQLEYDIAHIGKKRVIAEAWNLPQEFNAAFNFRLQGLNRTTPDSFECFLEGQGLTDRLSTDSINETEASAYPPYLDDGAISDQGKPTLRSLLRSQILRRHTQRPKGERAGQEAPAPWSVRIIQPSLSVLKEILGDHSTLANSQSFTPEAEIAWRPCSTSSDTGTPRTATGTTPRGG